MEISTLENWLWDAACAIRGPHDAPKFKVYILLQVLTEQALQMQDRLQPKPDHSSAKVIGLVSE